MKQTIAGCSVALLLGFLFIYFHTAEPPAFQEGLDAYEGLPEDATDINVYVQRNITGNFCADFLITEVGFNAFASENGWSLKEIPDQGFDVFKAKAFSEGRPNHKKMIEVGLCHSNRRPNGGGITIAYDRTERRGYIERSSR